MLKARVENELWLVHQPDHARVSGFLAAHWGNSNGFAQPGNYASSKNAGLFRQEVVHAIAEHDNGWWEWEAAPEIDPADGLPLNLSEMARERPDAGLQRWQLGVSRLADEHPYVSLLIGWHAYWLYAFAFDDLPELDDAFRHPLFGRAGNTEQLMAHRERIRSFLDDQLEIQRGLSNRMRDDRTWAGAVEPQHLLPHVRLLQVTDALSLWMCFGGKQTLTVTDVPGLRWDDRQTMTWKPEPNRRIVCHPYPFDTDPLEVLVPGRLVSTQLPHDQLPLIRLHATPVSTMRFELCSRD